MKTTASTAILVASLLISLPACKPEESSSTTPAETQAKTPTTIDGPEAAAKQIAKLQNDLAAVMESITDQASAEAAIAKVGPIAEQFATFGKKMETMDPDVSPELKAKLEAIIKPAQDRVQNAMTKAMPIITQNPEIAQKFQDAMSKMTATE
jgi:hypothetical protein